MRNRRMRIFLRPTLAGREETTCVFWRVTTRRDEVKTVEHEPRRYEAGKFTIPILGVGVHFKGGLRLDPADKHIRNTTENQEKKFKVCLLSFSHQDMLFFFA